MHEYTVKLVLSTLQGGITLITKLLGGGGWGSIRCVVGVDLPSEKSASKGEVHEYIVKLVLSTVQAGMTLGGGCSSVFYEALLILTFVLLSLYSSNLTTSPGSSYKKGV